jgi:hypothetical protein
LKQKINGIADKYVSGYSGYNGKPKRREHDGVYKEEDRKNEIESSGLFNLIEKIDYTYEIRNDAKQFIKSFKSVPSFASVLDGLDNEFVQMMENEIEEVINSYGGYVDTLFEYSLYISKKVGKF